MSITIFCSEKQIFIPFQARAPFLNLLDIVDQVEEVRPPRVVPQDRQNPFTSLSNEEFIDRYRLSPTCTLQLLEDVQPRLPRARDGRGEDIHI